MLDLSKIEAGRLDIEERPTDLAKLVTDVKYVVAEAAERKGLAVDRRRSPTDVPRWLMLDGRHLRQVLLNLLGNAIKFTAAGDVRLAIARDGDRRLLFEVSDTGTGIEPERSRRSSRRSRRRRAARPPAARVWASRSATT